MSDGTSMNTGQGSIQNEVTSGYHKLRVWPPLLILVGMTASFLPDAIKTDVPTFQAVRMLGPAVGGILILLWWLTLSRARWTERVLGLVGTVVAVGLTIALADRSMVGVPVIIVTIPMGMTAFALAAILCRNRRSLQRVCIVLFMAALGFGFTTLLRGEGVWGNGSLGLAWRFSDSPEQRLVANRSGSSSQSQDRNVEDAMQKEFVERWLADPEWPGFRGEDRSGTVSRTEYASDWTSSPPEKLWTIPVGPGWSSFSVAGKLLFTQEQRGEMECVVCYSSQTGEEFWVQGIASRFEDSLGGPGPRATPTIAFGDLFVLGAHGQLMRMDARSGKIRWQSDLREIAKRSAPTWGFSSSPLVVGSVVIVHAGGKGDLGTLAFDVDSGDRVWSAAAGDHAYGSPQICQVDGQSFVAMLTNAGFDLIDPITGRVHLSHAWDAMDYRSLQPRAVGDHSILLPGGSGTRLINITIAAGKLTAQEAWTSKFMKPDFNDLVVFQEHAYGFDGTIFACIDLKTGERSWKGGRYGKGQVLLLKESGLLLVLSESGELVLLSATPSAHTELGRIQAVEGKTWNHPVVVGDRLYVRNSTEAACFRLPLASVRPVR